MKRLIFKRWVEIILGLISFTGLFIVCAFEWDSYIPYLIGLEMIIIPVTLELFYGRN